MEATEVNIQYKLSCGFNVGLSPIEWLYWYVAILVWMTGKLFQPNSKSSAIPLHLVWNMNKGAANQPSKSCSNYSRCGIDAAYYADN